MVFFTVLDSAYKPYNWVLGGTGTASQPEDQEIVSGIAGYPGLNFNASNQEYIDWNRTELGGSLWTTGGKTVIARINPTTGSSDVGSIFGTYQTAAINGFMLYFNDTGGADEGLAFIVGQAGSTLYANSGTKANYTGYEYTAGGRYNSFTRTVSVWQNGIQLDSTTDAGTAWLTTTTNYLHTGRIPNSANWYTGNIYWIAVFDRELTDAEMVVWQTKDPFELIYPPESTLDTPANLPYALTNEVEVLDSFSGQSPYYFTTDLVAGCALAGDLASVPPVPPTYALSNEVLVVDAMVAVSTGLIVLQNVVTVTAATATFTTFALANEVLVGGSLQSTVGNIIAAGRFKR